MNERSLELQEKLSRNKNTSQVLENQPGGQKSGNKISVGLLLYDFSQEVIARGSERVNRRGSPAGVAWEQSDHALAFGWAAIFFASVASVVFHPALSFSLHARAFV